MGFIAALRGSWDSSRRRAALLRACRIGRHGGTGSGLPTCIVPFSRTPACGGAGRTRRFRRHLDDDAWSRASSIAGARGFADIGTWGARLACHLLRDAGLFALPAVAFCGTTPRRSRSPGPRAEPARGGIRRGLHALRATQGALPTRALNAQGRSRGCGLAAPRSHPFAKATGAVPARLDPLIRSSHRNVVVSLPTVDFLHAKRLFNAASIGHIARRPGLAHWSAPGSDARLAGLRPWLRGPHTLSPRPALEVEGRRCHPARAVWWHCGYRPPRDVWRSVTRRALSERSSAHPVPSASRLLLRAGDARPAPAAPGSWSGRAPSRHRRLRAQLAGAVMYLCRAAAQRAPRALLLPSSPSETLDRLTTHARPRFSVFTTASSSRAVAAARGERVHLRSLAFFSLVFGHLRRHARRTRRCGGHGRRALLRHRRFAALITRWSGLFLRAGTAPDVVFGRARIATRRRWRASGVGGLHLASCSGTCTPPLCASMRALSTCTAGSVRGCGGARRARAAVFDIFPLPRPRPSPWIRCYTRTRTRAVRPSSRRLQPAHDDGVPHIPRQ